MNVLRSDDLWVTLRKLAGRNRPLHAAVAYATCAEGFRWKRGDTLVCDASEENIRGGRTSASFLSLLHKAGVNVYSQPGLHAKVIVAGGTAVVGSANLSRQSPLLTEAAIFAENPATVAAARNFIGQLARPAALLDRAAISSLLEIPVIKPVRVPARGPRVSVPEAKFLVLALGEHPQDATADHADRRAEDLVAERSLAADVEWLATPRSNRKIASLAAGDSVIRVVHWDRGRPEVHAACSVLTTEVVGARRITYLEVPHGNEKQAITVRAFTRLLRAAGCARPLKRRSSWFLSRSTAARLTALW